MTDSADGNGECKKRPKTDYRILSFDGGGIRGILSTVILEQLNVHLDLPPDSRDWIEQADLIAGTSVGGMAAIGLAHGLTPTELRNLFYNRGPIMFEDSLFDDIRNVGRLFGAEFSTKNRREVLDDVLQDTLLKDLRQKVLIPTFDLHDPKTGRWQAKFFHNFVAEEGKKPNTDRERRASDVALYTSAAPTYFPSAGGYVDGGLVANNPAMAALAQTQDMNYRGWREGFEGIVLLSIGTGIPRNYVEGDERDWGYVQWGKHLATAVDDGLIGVTDYQCKQLLRGEYRRVDCPFPPGENVGVEEYEKRDYLVEIGETGMHNELHEAARWIEGHWL
ncbi:MAG: patatin-like phospholipase family protein [Gemmatimonadota bacterium]|nr:patatin-like phospholipase family protein [Gemmatimonadota bacterium]MDH3423279.1 patatin-like phospholipase family protein [Gemmatimonadota bacterium]